MCSKKTLEPNVKIICFGTVLQKNRIMYFSLQTSITQITLKQFCWTSHFFDKLISQFKHCQYYFWFIYRKKSAMTLFYCYSIYFILTSCLRVINPFVPSINTKYHICQVLCQLYERDSTPSQYQLKVLQIGGGGKKRTKRRLGVGDKIWTQIQSQGFQIWIQI